MKRLLKDQKTGLYLRNMDEWTHDPEQAYSFRDIFQALRFCDEHHLGEIAVVGRSKDGGERLLGFRHAANKADQTPQMTPNGTVILSKPVTGENQTANSVG